MLYKISISDCRLGDLVSITWNLVNKVKNSLPGEREIKTGIFLGSRTKYNADGTYAWYLFDMLIDGEIANFLVEYWEVVEIQTVKDAMG